MKRVLTISLGFLALACIGCAGCARRGAEVKEPPVAAGEDGFQEVPPNPLYDLFQAVDELLSAEDREGATRMFLEAMDNPEYDEHRAELFTTLIRFLLFTEQVDMAKVRFLNIIRTEPELALPGFDLIYGHYARQGDPEATLAWVRDLLLQPLTEPMQRPAREWLVLSLAETGTHPEMLERMAEFVRDQDPEDTARLLQRLGRLLHHQEQLDALGELLEIVEQNPGPEDGLLMQELRVQRLVRAAAQQDWERVQAGFPEAVSSLPDRPLQSLLSNLVGMARRAGRPGEADRLAETVLRTVSAEAHPGSMRSAAREWIQAAVDREELALVPERIGELLVLKLPPRQVYLNVSRHFYALLEHPDVLRPLLAQADVLSPLLEDDATRNALHALMLDGAFVLEDYDRALALLAGRVGDRDEEWHAMATAKVRAHKAIEEGDTDAAIEQLRAFMAVVATSEEPSPDPVTGILHTREMILGRNTLRIGELHATADRMDEARATFAEARALYELALQQEGLSEPTRELIRQEMAAIPEL